MQLPYKMCIKILKLIENWNLIFKISTSNNNMEKFFDPARTCHPTSKIKKYTIKLTKKKQNTTYV